MKVEQKPFVIKVDKVSYTPFPRDIDEYIGNPVDQAIKEQFSNCPFSGINKYR